MRGLLNIFLLTICFTTFSTAQTTVLGGIINKYSRVSKVDTCTSTVTVAEPAFFTVGSKVLVIQTNGATIQNRNNDNYGTLESLRNSGRHEINEIDSIVGNVVYLKYKFFAQYNESAGSVQLVTFPSYNNAVVNDTIKAKPWDGNTGGIIAFEANTITLNAPITTSGMGFRGGMISSYSQCESFQNVTDYYFDIASATTDNGGQKGESVAPYLTGKECGRGAQLTGGGGGNNHKSGGGGGAHLTVGGQGGETIRSSVLRCQGKNPGLGGIPLPSSISTDFMFFGGGGGSGHNKESANSKGGNGGGIILIKANQLEGNNKVIATNGATAALCDGDGAGGGGAGGSIALEIGRITGNLTLEAKGGAGGNSVSIPNYDFGPGGGAAGGRIILSNSTTSVTTLVTGGVAGKNTSTANTQSATNGANGVSAINSAYTIPIAKGTVIRKLEITKQPVALLVCEGDVTSLTVNAVGPALKYQWEINKGTGYTPLSNDADYDGVTTSVLQLKRPTTALNPFLYRCAISSNCLSNAALNTSEISLKIKTIPIPIFSYSIKNNKVEFSNGTSNGLTFKWSFGDGAIDTLRSPTHTYAQQDTYRVTLIASNECGTVPYSTVLNLNTQPTAAFTANGVDACPPTFVTFTNTSSDNVRKYFWTFQGGTPGTSTEKNPVIEYNSTGLYDVQLIVENGFGRDTFLKKQYVRINGKPKVNFTATKNGLIVNFLNNTTSATNYLWNFGDGNTSTQLSPVYTYKFAGTYIVTLKATNACGSVTDSATLAVFALPNATINASQLQGCSPMSVQFSGRNTTNVATWNWSFPGGVPATSNQANPRVTYSQPGNYDVVLTMTNSAGTNTVRQDTFIKVALAPKVSFNQKITDNVVEAFNTSADATKYTWNFGDGYVFVGTNPPPHAYSKNGIYTLVLLGENEYCSVAIEKQVSIFFFTATKDLTTEGGLTAYPNPTNGKLYLEFKDNTPDILQLKIADTHGKILKNTKITKLSTQELDINDLANGVYFLYFSSENKRFVRKIIKM